jgi:hypothetical protein
VLINILKISSIITVSVFAYFLVVSINLFIQYKYWSSELNSQSKYLKILSQDSDWAKFRPPDNVTQYMILWLFNIDHNLRIKAECEFISSDSIKHVVFKINYKNEIILAKLKKSLANVPFGYANFTQEENNCGKLTWYSSAILPKNNNLPKIPESIVLHLESVLLHKNGWDVNLNSEWISHQDTNSKVKIINVQLNNITVIINTPQGRKSINLVEGKTVEVHYI